MKVSARPDSIDLEHLNELSVNFGYRMVSTRLKDAYASTAKELATAATWERVRFLQGRLDGLSLALALPDQLALEVKAKLKEG